MIEIFGEQITYIEIAGTVFGIAGVWLTIRQNIFCFPAGIINVALYAYLFFKSKLYADAGLQIIYIALLVYGWMQWKEKTEDKKLQVTRSDNAALILFAIIGIGATVLLGTFLYSKTDASLPYLDALTTVMSLIAQWLIAKKKIENWLIWIMADVIYVGMYIYKSLYLTSGLYFIFILLAVLGYMEWKKSLKQIPSNA
ncbi:MAG TPA: nicotinamide riboside transporter PnuC [Bacteroidia bacterium]|nr:nicotinamide riboside transporter PnuC [Bacteroidia bacterium]